MNYVENNFLVARTVITPDGTIHIIRLPFEHWETLDRLISESFVEFNAVLGIAWRAWNIPDPEQPDMTFGHVFGYAIQEAYVQYETWINGFTNDNQD